MQTVDRIIKARWLVPVHSKDYLDHHALIIHNGAILDIIPNQEVKKRYKSDEVICLDQHHLLMPGFINCHGHAPMSLLRGFADDLSLSDWLKKHIWPAEEQWVSEEFVAAGTELSIAEMLKAGITTYADHYTYSGVSAKIAEQAGIRCRLYHAFLDTPTKYAKTMEEYLMKAVELIEEYRGHELISVGLGPHAIYTVSDIFFKQIIGIATKFKVPMQIHLHETRAEIAESIERVGVRPIEHLASLGFFTDTQVQVVHMTQVNQRDIELLRQYDLHVVHCPSSNLKLVSGMCPVERLLRAGINVCLGTDSAASNNRLDLMREMQTAAQLAKMVSESARALPAIEAVRMATLYGAKALSLDDSIGSLQVGKQADCIAIDFDTLSSYPVYDPISHLAYATDRQQVSHVWINGRCQMNNRQLVHLDEAKIKERVIRWQEKIRPE